MSRHARHPLVTPAVLRSAAVGLLVELALGLLCGLLLLAAIR